MSDEHKPYIHAHLKNLDAAEIEMFFVPRSRRKKGVGTALYLDWEKTLPKTVKRVELFAADTSEGRSDGFWESLGFIYKFAGDEDELGYELAHWMWKGVNGHTTPQRRYIPHLPPAGSLMSDQ
jgi:Acetyltransferase (GNAT) family